MKIVGEAVKAQRFSNKFNHLGGEIEVSKYPKILSYIHSGRMRLCVPCVFLLELNKT